MRIAIVENTRATHHGQVGIAMHEAGAKIDLYKPWSGQALPQHPDADALVVFGGEQNARADAKHPYLPQLAQLIADYTALDRPVLGICLGAQLMARAFGADNLLNHQLECGWTEVSLTDAGRTDPVLASLPPSFPIYEWHSDSFQLPQGAVHLARSAAVENQCFRIGRATYGMQFHFEASQAVSRDWNRSFPDMVEAMRPGWLKDYPGEAQKYGAAADAHGLAIARAWTALI